MKVRSRWKRVCSRVPTAAAFYEYWLIAVVVGLHRNVISCESARRGVRRSMAEAGSSGGYQRGTRSVWPRSLIQGSVFILQSHCLRHKTDVKPLYDSHKCSTALGFPACHYYYHYSVFTISACKNYLNHFWAFFGGDISKKLIWTLVHWVLLMSSNQLLKPANTAPLNEHIIIIIITFFTPVLNSQGMKKIRYAIQKSTKIKLEWTLLLLLFHKTVMQ